jgi:hypothetical protein
MRLLWNLVSATLNSTVLRGAKFGNALLWDTTLVDVDLSSLCDADPPVQHLGGCGIDYRSVFRSLRAPYIKEFLQRVGMPGLLVEYTVECARYLNGSIIRQMLQSTFISYGTPDEPFARKLYEALHRNGVTTFFFPEHAPLGQKLHRVMRRGVNDHDRVILICSESSLDRKGVLNEIEEALAREARDGGAAYIIPIRLDDYLFDGWNPANPDTAQALRDRVVADFRGADIDAAKFDAGLLRLIAALKKD